jgi:hypothetical protein
MRRTLTAIAVGLGVFGGLAAPAHARPFSCSGVPSQPKAYVCIVDSKGGATPYIDEEDVTVPAFCPALDFCTDPVTQPVPFPGATVVQGWWLILWYDGQCYYFYPDGHYNTVPSETAAGCP